MLVEYAVIFKIVRLYDNDCFTGRAPLFYWTLGILDFSHTGLYTVGLLDYITLKLDYTLYEKIADSR